MAPDRQEHFSRVATQFASGNYDQGQRSMETDGYWNDELRGIAVEANRAEQERLGEKSIDYDGAKSVLDSIADQFEEMNRGVGGLESDRNDALVIRGIIRGTEMPGEKGIQNIDEALKYLEGATQSQSRLIEGISDPSLRREALDQLRAKRAARDALYTEKQRRVEELKQSKSAESFQELVSNPKQTIEYLGNLYNMAGVPEEIPSRQELQKRVERMSEEELRYFNREIDRLKFDYDKSGDKSALDAALSGLATMKFTKTEVAQRRERTRQKKLGEVRRSLGMESENIPTDRRGLIDYYRANFLKIENLSLEQFRIAFDSDTERKYQAYVSGILRSIIEDQPVGSRYPDTVASIFANDASMLQRIVSIREGRVVDQGEILRQPFSVFAENYLNIDVPADYFEHFSKRSY